MCNGIGNRREATGNSKMRIAFDSTSVSGTAVFQPFVPARSEKISKNQDHVRDRARRRWTALWKRRRVGRGGFGEDQGWKSAALRLLGAR